MRKSPEIDCIYENFKYESDLATFLSSLKEELAKHKTEIVGNEKILIKKSSDSQLLHYKEKKKKGGRRYSD